MKKILTLIISILILSGQAYAQEGNYHQKREDIRKKKYAFVIKELQLTDKEKKDFMPMYQEFDRKREEIHMEKRKMMHNFKQNSLNISDDELNMLIDEFVNIDIKLAQLGKIYTNKFKDLIPPMKIILLHHTENQFKRMLLKHAHNKDRGPNSR